MEKVYIRITLFRPPEREDIVWIHSIELSPPKFDSKVKYGIAGYHEEHSFEELQKDLRIEEENGQRHKYFIKRGMPISLFVGNAETGKKQIFYIDVSKIWSVRSKAGQVSMIRSKYIEITPHLEKIGIL